MMDDSYLLDVSWLAHAIADSYRLKPRQWLTKYGVGAPTANLPQCHKHLLSDYRSTLKDMRTQVRPFVRDIDGNSMQYRVIT